MDTKPCYLKDAAILRFLLIVALVLYHAFAPYSGAWPKVDGIDEISVYWWFDNYIRAFLLESFVFLSGYVLGYKKQIKDNNILTEKHFIINKFKRLIVPSMVFSLLYILIFGGIKQPVVNTLYDIISGVGHLWFLTMLFWCFVIIWIVEKLQLKYKLLFPFLLLCSLCSYSRLPFQLGYTMYYMVFFYLGFIINSNSIQLSLIDKPLFMIIILVSFFAFFPILYVFKQNTDEIEFVNNPIVERLLVSFLKHLCGMTYSSLGCLMLFSVVRYLYRKKALSCRAVEIGGLGMGIFIIHQFILKMLYWHTDMSLIFGSYVLPWAATFITLIISICFTFCMLQFSLGRLLLGQTKYSYHLK